ncbi:MAG: lamin tail domain-containing protein [Chitinophagales bacterium]|nr:lamin tail domain-containing protein [Chitinophagales bacterium]
MRLLLCALALLITCASLRLSAQITDNFSDGDFTANHVWTGDAGSFIVNTAGELQLKAPAAGNAQLRTQGNIPDSALWSLDFRLSFAPSTSNLLRIYLLADQQDLTTANGYFLEIGENGSADALRFFRQDAGVKTLLASGVAGLVGTDPVNIKLQMRRSKTGVWNLSAGTGNLAPQFEFSDATHSAGANRFFGFYCLFSETRKENFFFDNISILPDIPDNSPPQLLDVLLESNTSLLLQFNEALDTISATDPDNYALAPPNSNISAATFGNNNTEVRLSFSPAFSAGNYEIRAFNIEDQRGNTAAELSANFSYVLPVIAQEFDLLINELMPDPSPSVGLPESEWVEIFNRSNKTLELSDLSIDDGGTAQTLPAFKLPPGGYALLCTVSAAAGMSTVADTVLAMSLPALNNDGDVLTIKRKSDGFVVDKVAYSINWHTDASKREGGWTLERVDPQTPCLGAANWKSCSVLPGGTPGARNAVFARITDTTRPRMLEVFPLSDQRLRVKFSKNLSTNIDAQNTFQTFSAYPVLSAEVSEQDRSVLTVDFGLPFQPGIVYQFICNENASDCSGNKLVADTLLFGLPQVPAPGDIVINEMMFNPATGGARYVELYNRSEKVFSWEYFWLANFSQGADVEPVATQKLFLPGDYAVLTTFPEELLSRFKGIFAEKIIDMNFPGFDDSEGNCTLYYSKDGLTISLDTFYYRETLHNALLNDSDREGVALERLSSELPAAQDDNWASASPLITGEPGTPTLPNSQGLRSKNGSNLINLPVARLSPDNDGYEDFLEIQYTLPKDGYAASVRIFDGDGLPVRYMVRSQLIGTEGILRWDGETDEGDRARPGIYILWMEIFHPDGQVEQVKKSFALVER